MGTGIIVFVLSFRRVSSPHALLSQDVPMESLSLVYKCVSAHSIRFGWQSCQSLYMLAWFVSSEASSTLKRTNLFMGFSGYFSLGILRGGEVLQIALGSSRAAFFAVSLRLGVLLGVVV